MHRRNREIERKKIFSELKPLLEEQEIHQEATFRDCNEADLMAHSRDRFLRFERGAFVSVYFQPPEWQSLQKITKSSHFAQDVLNILSGYDGECQFVLLFFPDNTSIFSGYVVQEWSSYDDSTKQTYWGYDIKYRIAGDPFVREEIIRPTTLNESWQLFSESRHAANHPSELPSDWETRPPCIVQVDWDYEDQTPFDRIPTERITVPQAIDLHERIRSLRSQLLSDASLITSHAEGDRRID